MCDITNVLLTLLKGCVQTVLATVGQSSKTFSSANCVASIWKENINDILTILNKL